MKHTPNAFKGDLRAVLCVDNDEAGKKFINKIENEKIPFLVCTPSEKYKDWNEQLTDLRTSVPISRLIERNNKFIKICLTEKN